MPTSVVSVLLLKRQDIKIYKSLIYAALTLEETKQPWASKRLDGAASTDLQCIQFFVFEKVINDGHRPLWSKCQYLFIGQTDPSQFLLCLPVKP